MKLNTRLHRIINNNVIENYMNTHDLELCFSTSTALRCVSLNSQNSPAAMVLKNKKK